MRFTKAQIIVAYILAIVAIVFYVTAWLNAGDTQQATYYVTNGCFCLLLSIWANVCS